MVSIVGIDHEITESDHKEDNLHTNNSIIWKIAVRDLGCDFYENVIEKLLFRDNLYELFMTFRKSGLRRVEESYFN